ncbi:hypothetical protein FACS1894152_8300 [Bacilli bacterium]|nr:hypothetical protein FACS1894152_8300 [Bacilli bacterium]
MIQASLQIKDFFSTFGYDQKDSFAVDTYIEADHRADQKYEQPDDHNGDPAILVGDNLTAFDKFTKQDYLDHNSDKKYKEGNYIRQDKEAKEYRKLAKTLTKLFPEVDLSTSKSVALQ